MEIKNLRKGVKMLEFVLGFLVGSFSGILLLSLLIAGRREDDD